MIQRIQSIFLALAAFACFGLFATDVADTDQAVADSELFADASFNVFDSPVLMGAVGLAGALFLVAIFLYGNRKTQLLLGTAGATLLGVAVGYGVMSYFNDAAADSASPDLGIALPVLAFIFSILAASSIKKDEKLVRSADRLR